MRIKNLQKILREKKLDCAILSSLSQKDVNVSYYIGQKIMYSVLFIPKKGKSILFVPEMEYGLAKSKVVNCTVKVIKQGFSTELANILKKRKMKKVGINKGKMTVNEFESIGQAMKGIKFEDISVDLMKIRAVKEKEELRKTVRACRIVSDIFDELGKKIHKMKRETDVRDFLLLKTAENGCEKAFNPVVATGKNSGFVHYEGTSEKIKNGFALIDYGVTYEGYKSDITRTFFIGSPNNKQVGDYNLLLDIQKKAINMVKPGVKAKDIDVYVRKAMGKYNDNYPHALGHGVGLNIHEWPGVSINSEATLEEGMVLTIEPGFYFPNNYGIRIEDTVVVTKTGCKILTKSNKEMIVKKR